MGRSMHDPSPGITSNVGAHLSSEGDFIGAGEGRFKSAKLSKPTFLESIFLVGMMTVCWCFIALSVDIIRRPVVYEHLDSGMLSAVYDYVQLFKSLDGGDRDKALSGLLTLLAGVATLALALRGMTWQKQDLPENVRMHGAWLQRVVDTSARETAAVMLMAALCGAYGFIVVCYGFLVGANGWRGLGLPFFIILLVLYAVVAVLPAFISKSDAGEISGYASILIEVVNLAEWRYQDQRDAMIVGGGAEVGGWCDRLCGWLRAVCAFLCRGCGGLRGLVGKYAGLAGVAVVVVSVTSCIYLDKDWGTALLALAALIGVAFVLELAVWDAVLARVQIVSAGRVSFGSVFLRIPFFVVALLIWVLYAMCVVLAFSEEERESKKAVLTFPGWVGLVVLVVLVVWWVCRMLLAWNLKPRDEGGRRGRQWLEETAGLRSEIEYQLDLVLLKDKLRLDSYSGEGSWISGELAVVTDLVAPKSYVMRRSSESESLREYLSDIVGLSLPSMLVRRDALPQSTKPFVMPRGGSGKRR
ncbi:hypothetical protein J5X07_09735 [Actinomyces bowdenii]|uniref:hypothetical protein n=1 Tax=Actinomyces bowdenii TaxID=131109 RepID=UPI001ABC441A|nr:hypothetical protein [Actinomyces bowdenii]MBO3725301.1 hypothetical protein [Actinomyces bowdenii]